MTTSAAPTPSTGKRLWRWVRVVLTVGALVGLVFFFVKHADALKLLTELDPLWLLVIAATYSGLVVTRGLALKVGHYKALPEVSLSRWWAVAVVTGALNHLLVSSAGGAWRALTLKVNRSVALTDSLAIQLWLFFSLAAVGAFGMAVGVAIADIPSELRGSLQVIAGVGATASIAALIIAKRAAEFRPASDAPRWQQILGRASAVGINNPAILRMLLVSMVNFLLGSLAVYAGFAAIGIELPIFVALIFGALLTLSTLLVLRPGNIGIIEGVVGAMAAFIERDVETAVTAMLVVRVLNLASVVVPAPFALKILKQWKPDEPR